MRMQARAHGGNVRGNVRLTSWHLSHSDRDDMMLYIGSTSLCICIVGLGLWCPVPIYDDI